MASLPSITSWQAHDVSVEYLLSRIKIEPFGPRYCFINV